MKKIIIGIISLFILMGCGAAKKQAGESNVFGAMRAYNVIYTENQVDSMCVADTLPMLEEWKSTSYVDYETGKRITRAIYVKCLTDENEMTYVVITKENGLYKVVKRFGNNE